MDEKIKQKTPHLTVSEAHDKQEMRLQIEQALADPKARLPVQLNADFYDYQYTHQSQYLRQVNVIGQVAFALYFFADYFILQDVTLLSASIRFVIIVLAVVSNYYLFKYVRDIRILDLILPLGTLVCVPAWFYILSQSNSPLVNTYLYASFIFIVLVNLAIQVRFRPILYLSLLISSIMLAGVVSLTDTMNVLVYVLAYLPILLFSLFISYTTTLNARRNFLRTLLNECNAHTLQHLAHTDELTQLSNRREFLDRAESEVKQWPKHASTCLFMFDIDHFKQVNDNYGHDVGDHVLQVLASLARKEVRRKDILARFGGEEFIALLSESNLEETMIIAERLRKRIATHDIQLENNEHFNFTVSIGVASLAPEEDDLNVLIKQADIALYHAKARGRNQVVAYDTSMPEQSEAHTKQITSWVI